MLVNTCTVVFDSNCFVLVLCCPFESWRREASRVVRNVKCFLWVSCVRLLFLVNPERWGKTDYLLLSCVEVCLFTWNNHSFASPFLTDNLFHFFPYMYWLIIFCWLFVALYWQYSNRHVKSQTGYIFTSDPMHKLNLTLSEIWKIWFIYPPWAEQAAWEPDKLSYYLFP